MIEHSVKSFDDEIGQLRCLVVEMGGLAEVAISEAIAALSDFDFTRAVQVVKNDVRLDSLEAEVDRLATQTLALRSPMEEDMLEVIAALKISNMIELIGDCAKNIAKRVPAVKESSARIAPMKVVPAMAETAQSMMSDVLNAYVSRDATLAVEVIRRDEALDNFFDSLFRNFVSHMIENPATISSAAHLLFVARNLERIGDYATNAAEMVYFEATGRYFSLREMAVQSEKA
jgi:phosphate transport system protein